MATESGPCPNAPPPPPEDGIEAQSYPNPEQQLEIHANPDPTQPADNKPSSSSSFFHSLVRIDHGDLILFACSFCSGLVDSSSFAAYTTFVSMQTGNTIFLTLAVSTLDPKPDSWLRPLLAVLFFCIGSVLFSRIYLHLGARRRVALIINFATQTIFVMLAAALTQKSAVSGQVPATLAAGYYPLTLVPIALLSFQSASQVVTSRALEVGELPTVVVTSMLCDLFSDPHIFAPPMKNVKRNRRAAGFLNTFVGGVIGGLMGRRTGGISAALFLAAGIKACMALAWFVWPAEGKKRKGKQDV